MEIIRQISKQGRTTIVSFHIPRRLLDRVDYFVKLGIFNNRSEAFRTAIYSMLRDLEKTYGIQEPKPEVGYR
jgi:Arc/MetJ-type ribon-helix-helix transcriptional regulator